MKMYLDICPIAMIWMSDPWSSSYLQMSYHLMVPGHQLVQFWLHNWTCVLQCLRKFIVLNNNRTVAQIAQCTNPISHNAPFCNRNVHICAHFYYKMMHCGIFVWCIMGYLSDASWDLWDGSIRRCHFSKQWTQQHFQSFLEGKQGFLVIVFKSCLAKPFVIKHDSDICITSLCKLFKTEMSRTWQWVYQQIISIVMKHLKMLDSFECGT